MGLLGSINHVLLGNPRDKRYKGVRKDRRNGHTMLIDNMIKEDEEEEQRKRQVRAQRRRARKQEYRRMEDERRQLLDLEGLQIQSDIARSQARAHTSGGRHSMYSKYGSYQDIGDSGYESNGPWPKPSSRRESHQSWGSQPPQTSAQTPSVIYNVIGGAPPYVPQNAPYPPQQQQDPFHPQTPQQRYYSQHPSPHAPPQSHQNPYHPPQQQYQDGTPYHGHPPPPPSQAPEGYPPDTIHNHVPSRGPPEKYPRSPQPQCSGQQKPLPSDFANFFAGFVDTIRRELGIDPAQIDLRNAAVKPVYGKSGTERSPRSSRRKYPKPPPPSLASSDSGYSSRGSFKPGRQVERRSGLHTSTAEGSDGDDEYDEETFFSAAESANSRRSKGTHVSNGVLRPPTSSRSGRHHSWTQTGQRNTHQNSMGTKSASPTRPQTLASKSMPPPLGSTPGFGENTRRQNKDYRPITTKGQPPSGVNRRHPQNSGYHSTPW